MPGGKLRDSSAILALIPSAVSSALAPASCRMASAAEGLPLKEPLMSGSSVPSSVLPMSRICTTEPSASVRRGMFANCSGVTSSDWTTIEALRRWPGMAGAPPNWPAETSTL